MRSIILAITLSACTSVDSSECYVDQVVRGRDVVVWQLSVDVESVSVHLFSQYAVGVQCWLVPPSDEPVTVVDRVIVGGDLAYAYTGRYSGGVLICAALDEWIRYGEVSATCGDSSP